MSILFKSIKFKNLILENRVIIAPMCQYSSENGELSYWHEQQWASYALSGAGLCIIEATAIQPEGRISYADLGIWNDTQCKMMQTLLSKIKKISPTPFAIQLAHAGRKASCDTPWGERNGQFTPDEKNGWQTIAPSAISFQPNGHPPISLSTIGIKKVISDFVAAAQRSVLAGFDLIELHAAHGYLLHQFLSPLSNQRTDEYGGSFENRIRLTLEIFKEIKKVVPKNYPIGVRISATDWVNGGWDLRSSIELSKILEQIGVAYIHVTSGGLHKDQKIDIHPEYQVPFANEIKKAINVPVIAVGLITHPEQAERILQAKQADAIGIARGILYDPRWSWHAAVKLNQTIAIAPQYFRFQPRGSNQIFKKYAS
ncbi:NADH:flavin oxidoreductase/NADH oxidase [Acinetobacter sp. R933-2]|uniref:NADH:flavin oxidoreductase/NADH oxidase n=1 Tax=Acinetobacter sp. R933-2 TaxID=2746728 RepID=UPI0025781F3B|nr:NADH:flavin oxidoreductase/NADH oxidase [Acinetobacter sp. R933-2]MDM1247648.1 NADH:flavin oxidoreductase/NADH oxidase [Acinetobacter sp. R933-2]